MQKRDEVVDVFYKKAKIISLKQFNEYYLDVFKNVKFYISPYDVDPEKVNRNREFQEDPLVKIIDQQREQEVNAQKKKMV